jgi:hypothetical protein
LAVVAEVLGAREQTKFRERVFYTTMAFAILIVIFVGFSRTFYLRPYFFPEHLIPLLILHGTIFSSWMALFVTQTTLVATKNTRIHMKLGVAGLVIAILMLLVGTYTALVRAKGPSPLPDVNPLAFLTIPLGDMLVFGILFGAAYYYRKKLDTHKRLMLLASIALLPAGVARWPLHFIETGGPLVFYGLADLFIVPCLIFDIITRGKPHRATVLGGALIVASHPLRLIIGGTHAWLVFATWATSWT